MKNQTISFLLVRRHLAAGAEPAEAATLESLELRINLSMSQGGLRPCDCSAVAEH